MVAAKHWQQRVGSRRDWVWRGWQTRYTYVRPPRSQCDSMPLILLHGFGASIGHWRYNLEVLGRSRPVYALDLLGFGASEKASTSYKIALWVEQVYDFWKTFIRRPAILVGNSIGSLVCLVAAATHPDMVGGIAMMSLPDPNLRQDAIPAMVRPAVTALEKLFASPLLLRPLFYFVRAPHRVRRWAKIAYADGNRVDDELVEVLSTPAYDRGAARAFARLVRSQLDRHFCPSVKTLLPDLDIPILLLWGRQDRMVPPKLARPQQFCEYNANLQPIELDEVGHCPHDESPDRVNAILLDWIATQSRSTPQPD